MRYSGNIKTNSVHAYTKHCIGIGTVRPNYYIVQDTHSNFKFRLQLSVRRPRVRCERGNVKICRAREKKNFREK